MSLTSTEIQKLNAASNEGNEDAKNLIKRYKANNYNNKYMQWNGQKKKNLWQSTFDYGTCGLLFLVGCVLLSLIWGAVDMGSSVTEGIHEFKYRNLTGWEVGFGPFYLQTWVTPDNEMPSGIKYDPGLGFLNFIALVGYLATLYGIFLFIMYVTYDGSHYFPEQIEMENNAIREAAVTADIFSTQEMEPLLYNSTLLKF